MNKTDEQIADTREIFEAIGIKGALARAAERHLRTTPEYDEARRLRCARTWLYAESHSFAESAYDLLVNRDLEPPCVG